MTSGDVVRTRVRVLMNLNEGYTRVMVEETEGLGLADGGFQWDIPTDKIPHHLRGIGSRFLLVRREFVPLESDSAEDIRRANRAINVEELD